MPAPMPAKRLPRVAYLINTYPMASETFIRREIRALESQGVRVFRFALRRWQEPVIDPADLEELSQTRYVLDQGAAGLAGGLARYALKHPERLARAAAAACELGRRSDRGVAFYLAYLGEAAVLLEWMKQLEILHLHAHYSSNPAAVAWLARQLGGPSYSFTAHGPTEFDVAALQGLREKIGDAAFVVAISSFCRGQLCRFSDPRDWDKIHIVRCGVDERYLAEPPAYDPHSQTLVSVGRLSEQKGQLWLLEAFRRVVDRYPKVQLVLVGDGELRPRIERRLRESGLNENVELTGWLDAPGVFRRLAAARALVLPSFAEGLPVVIMEALALARPVISTYVAGIPELVEPGKSGWLVPASNVDALVEAIVDCLQAAPERLLEMGRTGRAAVLKEHDVQQAARKILGHIQVATQGAAPDSQQNPSSTDSEMRQTDGRD